MKITILCVGKLKEKFYKDAVAEYAKRLLAYCTFQVIEVADESIIEGQEEMVVEKEGRRLLAKLPERAYVVALCIDGKARDSVELAHWMGSRMNQGDSHLVFVIGGSCGAGTSAGAHQLFPPDISARSHARHPGGAGLSKLSNLKRRALS